MIECAEDWHSTRIQVPSQPVMQAWVRPTCQRPTSLRGARSASWASR